MRAQQGLILGAIANLKNSKAFEGLPVEMRIDADQSFIGSLN